MVGGPGHLNDQFHFSAGHMRCRWRRQKEALKNRLTMPLAVVAGVGIATKIHLVCERHGWPLAFTLPLGQEADSRHFVPT